MLADLPVLLPPDPLKRTQLPAQKTRQTIMSNNPRQVRTVDISRDSTAAASSHGRHEILRLRYRGWFIDVDDTKVILPTQQWLPGMTPEDLMVCLAAAAAKARANTPLPARNSPEARLGDAVKLAKTMRQLQRIAAERWHPTTYDVYDCINQAWEESGMKVAHTKLVNSVRAALPKHVETLTEFNDTSRRKDLLALFDRALHQAELAAERSETAEAQPAPAAQDVA